MPLRQPAHMALPLSISGRAQTGSAALASDEMTSDASSLPRGLSQTASVTSASDLAILGSSLSIRQSSRIDVSILLLGIGFDSSLSVLDLLTLEPSLLVRSSLRCDSPLFVLSFAHSEPSPSPRQALRVDSAFLLFSTALSDSSMLILAATTTGLPSSSHGMSCLEPVPLVLSLGHLDPPFSLQHLSHIGPPLSASATRLELSLLTLDATSPEFSTSMQAFSSFTRLSVLNHLNMEPSTTPQHFARLGASCSALGTLRALVKGM